MKKIYLIMIILLPIFLSSAFSAEDQPSESSEANLLATVKYLSDQIGIRSYQAIDKLNTAADYIESAFREYGCVTTRQEFKYLGRTYHNVIGEVKGSDPYQKEILIIGAHYDTVESTPGADDNASGVAGLLELARLTAMHPAKRTIRFVAFSLEEPPVFGTDDMGSHFYAEAVKKEGAAVYGMISLEMLGYFCDQKGCQDYPPIVGWFFPSRGNFISFVGNLSSGAFTKKVRKSFVAASGFPLETLNTFSWVPGIDFSDHRNFWEFGFDAFMVTDTSFYRNANYHEEGDTWEKLDYGKMNEVVTGLFRAIGTL